MEHKRTDCVIVFLRQLRHQICERLVLLRQVFNACSLDKLVVQVVRHQRVGQRPEVGLQNGGDTTDVVEAIVIPQVE